MATTSFKKDPGETLDYRIDWSDWLGDGETISTSTWTAEAGITKGADSKTDTTTTVWLSGGTAGSTYRIEDTVTTNGSRTGVRSFLIVVQDR